MARVETEYLRRHMKYDLLIPSSPRYYNQLEELVISADKFLVPAFNEVHIVSPTNPNLDIPSHLRSRVFWHADDEFSHIDISQYKDRPRWMFQQMIKLTQKYTSENYLVADADVIFTDKLDLLTADGTQKLFFSHYERHKPYFDFMDRVFPGLEYLPFSCITEIMLMNRRVWQEALSRYNYSEMDFIQQCYKYSDRKIYLADYELFGTLGMDPASPVKYSPAFLERNYFDRVESLWTREERRYCIERSPQAKIAVFNVVPKELYGRQPE